MPGLQCPVCRQPLFLQDRTYRCAAGHSFDCARSGYVNLLRSQQSAKKRHGDDKRMVLARQTFLDMGFYQPLLQGLIQAVQKHLPDPHIDLLDIGCGECWYTAGLCAALRDAGQSVSAVGIDISKDALQLAAKRDPSITLAVASVSSLPVGDESCNLLLNLFAPLSLAEFARVMQKNGVLLRAVPLQRHLYGLKAQIYDRPYENPVDDPALDGFALIDAVDLTGVLQLQSQAQIQALFEMTPYYYKTGVADQQKLQKLDQLETEYGFGLRVYRKTL